MQRIVSGAASERTLAEPPGFSILGAGAWGTALAHHLGCHGASVKLWARRAELAEQLASARRNPLLPGVSLAASVAVSHQLEEVLSGASHVLLAAPSHTVRALLDHVRAFWPLEAVLVSAAKGIENDTLLTTTEVAEEVLGEHLAGRIVVLSGPSFAAEVARGQPTSLVAAAASAALAENIQQALSRGRLRVYASTDPVGVQVAGALKNVIAIAVGASDGLGLGQNARAALITRGLSEIARLAVAKGGRSATIAGLAGLGDLVLTCTGEMSRNRTVGFELGRGRPLQDVLSSLGHVAEGVTTARSADGMARALGVDLPICSEVCQVLYAGKRPADAVEDLLRRPLGRE